MIRLIASDLDGTLLPYGDREISDEIKLQIRKAEEQGIIFAVSSGRTYGELCEYLGELAERTWLICCDGAYYIKGEKCYYERAIDRADLELFFSFGGAFVLHGARKNYSFGRLPSEVDVFCAEPVDKLGDIKEKIFKLTSYGRQIRLPKYSGLRVHWDGEVDIAQYVNRYCDKGTALSDLQMRLMLTKFDTACLGDGGNDAAMMKNAKYAVCIGARSPELAKVCNMHFKTAGDALHELIDK